MRFTVLTYNWQHKVYYLFKESTFSQIPIFRNFGIPELKVGSRLKFSHTMNVYISISLVSSIAKYEITKLLTETCLSRQHVAINV